MDSKKYIRLQQVIQYHGISRHEITEWVEYEFFEVIQEKEEEYIREEELDKVERIIRLYRDLGVNSPGIDIILRLRDQLEELQKRS